MSIWTHVNGNIRFDGFEYNFLPQIHDYELPCGSEGPLEYHYQITGTGFVLANLTVWGDLRDYDNVDEIIQWIKEITKNRIIRSGLFEIVVEGQEPIILWYDREKEDWIKIKPR